MKQVLLPLFLIIGIGCSGSGNEPLDTGWLDVIDASDSDGEILLPDDITGDASDSGTVNDVVDMDSDEDTGCLHPHYFGDGKYGENCWDPPENLCKNGANAAGAWYCKPDGSLCCLSGGGGCFYCGWIECGYQLDSISDECQDIEIPQRFIDCAAEGSGSCSMNTPDVYSEMTEGECEFSIDSSYVVCWDDHVEETE